MGVVPIDEKLQIIEEATNNTLREIQLRSKTIDQLDVVEKVEATDKVELNGNRAATIGQLTESVMSDTAPEWEDF